MTTPQSGGWADPDPARPQPSPWQQPPPVPPLGAAPVPPGAGGPPGYGYPIPPGYQQSPRTNGLAITSMVVSIASVVAVVCAFCFSLLALLALGGGITGVILGFIARRQVEERGEQGNGMALAGIIVGFVATAFGLLALILGVLFFGLAMSGAW